MTENTSETTQAVVVRELELSELGSVHGVTCDAKGNVWFAHGDDGDLVCVEPQSGRVLRRFDGLDAMSGTAFDGTHIWQITGKGRIIRVDPETGEVVHEIAAPESVHCSGMAFVDGALWIGGFQSKVLVKVDAQTGEVLKTLSTDRLVTGVEWIDGQLWHGAWEREEEPVAPRLRRVDPDSGAVLEDVGVPDAWSVSGIGVDADGRLWCGGSRHGGLRAVRMP